MPDNLEVLYDDEKIPKDVAAEYLGVEVKNIKRIIKDGDLRTAGGRILLDDVNRIKSEK